MCGKEGFEHNLEPVGLVRGWAKAHSCANPYSTRGLKFEEGRQRDHTNPDLTCEQRSEDGKRIDPSSEEPKEQMHLGIASFDHLHQKIEHRETH